MVEHFTARAESPEVLLERILSSDRLPSVPAVAARVLSLTTDPNVDFAVLAETVSADPVIAAKLLRMANSPFFGVERRITSATEAMVRMGLKVTRMAALSFALDAEIDARAPAGFDLGGFWRHALTTAAGARLVAEIACPSLRDEAFSAGIMQDIGILALHCAWPDAYGAVRRECERHPTVARHYIERRRLGITHAEVGAEMLRRWGLPAEVYEPIRRHHDPDPADSTRLAQVLELSSRIAGLFFGRGKGIIRVLVMEDAPAAYGVTEQGLEELLDNVADDVRQIAGLFNLDATTIPAYDEIRARAARELAALTAQRPLEAQALQPATVRHLTGQPDAPGARPGLDPLTELPNRPDFDRRFEAELSRTQRHAHDLGLLLVDIDHLEEWSAAHGPAAADAMVRALARFLVAETRPFDSVARLDEAAFAALLPETDRRDLLAAAERLRLGVAEGSAQWVAGVSGITVSVGAVAVPALCPFPGNHLILDQAAQCLYQAKASGRNCTRYANLA